MKNTASQHLVSLARQRKLSHAYVLTGEDTVQKRHVTTAVIQALWCQEEDAPCQQCTRCQKIAYQQLADVFTLQPEGQTIKVDQIRELKEWLSRSSLEAGFKVAVIESADKMNSAAANALLMFLEEPVDQVYIFLYANRMSQLLPTICSRVQQVEVVSDEQNHQLLWQERGVSSAHAHVLQHLSAQSQEEWLTHYEAEAFELWVKELHYFYTLLAKKDIYSLVVVQTKLKSLLVGHQAIDGLDYLAALSSQWFKCLHGMDVANVSYYIKEIQDKLLPHKQEVANLYHLLIESKQYLQSNVNAQFVYERLALKICQPTH